MQGEGPEGGGATPGLGAAGKLRDSSAVGTAVGVAEGCSPVPAHLEEAASAPPREGRKEAQPREGIPEF